MYTYEIRFELDVEEILDVLATRTQHIIKRRNTTMTFLKSRTFWTLVLMFVINGYAAVSGNVPANLDMVVNLVLSIAATYFHINPSRTY